MIPATRKMHIKSEALKSGIERIKELCGDDPELLADMIEGELDLEGFADQIVSMVMVDEAMGKAIDDITAKYAVRKKRLVARAKTLRDLLAVTMDQAEIKKIETAVATISVKNAAPQVVVIDEAELPSRMFKDRDPVLDKKALKDEMIERSKALEELPKIDDPHEREEKRAEIDLAYPEIQGAEFSNGGFSLAIRVL